MFGSRFSGAAFKNSCTEGFTAINRNAVKLLPISAETSFSIISVLTFSSCSANSNAELTVLKTVYAIAVNSGTIPIKISKTISFDLIVFMRTRPFLIRGREFDITQTVSYA